MPRIDPKTGQVFLTRDERREQADARDAAVLAAAKLERMPIGLAVESGAMRVLTVEKGYVIVASDAHYWPDRDADRNPIYDQPEEGHRALVAMIRRLKPKAVILNGDIIDGASISRWPVGSSIELDNRPTVEEELIVAQTRLREIKKASRLGAERLFWPLGNHDSRFESRLMEHVPEYSNVYGTRLKDHFPDWTPCWGVMINGNTAVKHRFRNGIHATYNNTLHAGVSTVTGHLHAQNVAPFTDYRGTRYGIDAGMLARPYGPQFIHYTEANPVNWRQGFMVLQFMDSKLLPPEPVSILSPNTYHWNGKVYPV